MGILKMIMMFSSAEVPQALVRPFRSPSIYSSRYFDHELFWDVLKRGYTSPAGIPGSGAGKGGGGGGSVRQSGGGLGKYGAAQEEGYFHHKQREQLEKIKKQLKEGNPELTQKKDK